jgi:hypothetical protein
LLYAYIGKKVFKEDSLPHDLVIQRLAIQYGSKERAIAAGRNKEITLEEMSEVIAALAYNERRDRGNTEGGGAENSQSQHIPKEPDNALIPAAFLLIAAFGALAVIASIFDGCEFQSVKHYDEEYIDAPVGRTRGGDTY